MSIKLIYRSVQPTQYTQWKWCKTAQNKSIFACFWPYLGLFGLLLISRVCDIIKFVGLKKIISYGKVQNLAKTTPVWGVWIGSSSHTHWLKLPSAPDEVLRRFK